MSALSGNFAIIKKMRLIRLALKNWRNFASVDVRLEQRVFILGNNGLGKSNFFPL
ncbi:MAG: hypothetical protein R1F54_04235 [Candidatus Zeuxoniibacter abyssi]|nr:MAG: hypothetical protein R1F54_04235 [Candidatus Persebacteraceae bacterium AB1(2)]